MYIDRVKNRFQNTTHLMKQFLLVFFFSIVIIPLTLGQSGNRPPWLTGSENGKEKAPKIEVFPNPASTYINLTETSGVKRVAVYNLLGRLLRVFEEVGDGKNYYVGDLPRGMYLVQILGDQNKIVTTRRVSKE